MKIPCLPIGLVGKETTMSYEPPLDDPVATGADDECEGCGCYVYECCCNEPDRMYGDEDA